MTDLAGFASLFAEINNLKRIRTASFNGSLAEQCFELAWKSALTSDTCSAALHTTAQALARTRLGGIDVDILRGAGLNENEIAVLESRAFDAVAPLLEMPLEALLRGHLHAQVPDRAVPSFVDLLRQQPRAGATRPGHARLIVLPTESHADHCLVVGVYAVLLAPRFGADPAVPFLAALSHHLHNAYLPDSGFAGEELLGEFLQPVTRSLQQKALAGLDGQLAGEILCALARTADAHSPEGKAFHAADVLDRVLQMKWYEDAAHFTLRAALDEMELVHAGPVRDFQMGVLREAGLC